MLENIGSSHISEFTLSKQSVETLGSVRVDLLGGTLDLWPLNQILPDVVTLNVATSLQAKVIIEQTDLKEVEIISLDYDSKNSFKPHDFTPENFNSDFFGPLQFVCEILNFFKLTSHIKLTLESGSPAGAGLGGSSSMGVTIVKAIQKYLKNIKNIEPQYSREESIALVQNIEAKILNAGPAGYQDYYPALFGGILALVPSFEKVQVIQLFTHQIKKYLESHVTLVYSGEQRLSGINNWEVYKGFFDNPKGREGLVNIAKLSQKAFAAMESNKLEGLENLIAKEGAEREKLFPNILSPRMKECIELIGSKFENIGQKVCGAGGGGCFLITHSQKDKLAIEKEITSFGMKVLSFEILEPISPDQTN